MILAQVALYPIEAEDADQVINASLEELNQSDTMHFSVGPVNTEIQEKRMRYSALCSACLKGHVVTEAARCPW